MTALDKGHILIVEPNDITRKLIVGILNKKGYATYEAKDGDAATAFLKKGLQVVIIDIDTGDDGTAGLLHKLVNENAAMLVVAMSETASRADIEEAFNLRGVVVLKKPVVPANLVSNIESYFLSSIAEVVAQQPPPVKPAAKAAPVSAAVEETRAGFMRRALDLAQEKMDAGCGGPFGAVVVRGGKIIGEGWSRIFEDKDPTAHAEMNALRAAAKTLGTHDLTGCEIYSAAEPCPMCLAAIYLARVDRIFYGCTIEDSREIGFDDDLIFRDIAQPPHKRALPAKMLLRPEAQIVFDNWMKRKDKFI